MSIIKKAVLIGINYNGTSSQLNGCINDCKNLRLFLIKNDYLKATQMTLLNDDSKGALRPTKRNILRQFDALVKFANANKKSKVMLFLSYSGHGSYVLDQNGDEEDGYDEVICPLDYEKNGFITDDLIKRRLVDRLPNNAKIVMLMDCCFSGTVCDLKFNYDIDKRNSYKVTGDSKVTRCECIMVSGCTDEQTSADAYLKSRYKKKGAQYQGAMTASFIANYNDNITYYALISKMRTWLKSRSFTQIPQLSSGRIIDTKKRFLLTGYD